MHALAHPPVYPLTGTQRSPLLSGLFFMTYFYLIFFVFFNCFVSFVIDAFVARCHPGRHRCTSTVLACMNASCTRASTQGPLKL